MLGGVNSNESYLELPEIDELSTEQLDAQVQHAQEQLLALKRQQDLIEKQKRELEDMSRRQELLQRGKAEMVEKFTSVSVVLDRELFEAQKRVEQLREIQDAFAQHYHVLESIHPRHWEGADINQELSKALSAVEDARAEFHKALPRIQVDAPEGAYPGEEVADTGGHDFLYWLKIGFAFTLPLLILVLLGLLAFIFSM